MDYRPIHHPEATRRPEGRHPASASRHSQRRRGRLRRPLRRDAPSPGSTRPAEQRPARPAHPPRPAGISTAPEHRCLPPRPDQAPAPPGPNAPPKQSTTSSNESNASTSGSAASPTTGSGLSSTPGTPTGTCSQPSLPLKSEEPLSVRNVAGTGGDGPSFPSNSIAVKVLRAVRRRRGLGPLWCGSGGATARLLWRATHVIGLLVNEGE